MEDEENQEVPDTDIVSTVETRKQKYYENLLQFQSDVINPKTEDVFTFLNRDSDLGNIDHNTWLVIADRLDFANQLLEDGFLKSAKDLFSEIQSFLITSRSIDGFQQKMLTTSNQNQNIRSDISQVQSAPGGGGLMGMFRRKKR